MKVEQTEHPGLLVFHDPWILDDGQAFTWVGHVAVASSERPRLKPVGWVVKPVDA